MFVPSLPEKVPDEYTYQSRRASHADPLGYRGGICQGPATEVPGT